MRKWIRLLIGLMACSALAYSVYQMVFFGMEAGASSKLNDTLASQVVNVLPTQPPEDEQEPNQETAEQELSRERAPIQVDFAQLAETGSGVIGWLYCEDTPINLPLAQAEDNRYYLRRLLDGTENNAGTLFADYRCSGDFSDRNTVIYGHNMRNGTMFGTLRKYGSQEYYEAHPILWLLTPDGDYKVELLSGFVTSATSEAYSFPETEEETAAWAQWAMDQSTFTAHGTPAPGDRYLTLSTCSYEFEDARYVLLGRLVGLKE